MCGEQLVGARQPLVEMPAGFHADVERADGGHTGNKQSARFRRLPDRSLYTGRELTAGEQRHRIRDRNGTRLAGDHGWL